MIFYSIYTATIYNLVNKYANLFIKYIFLVIYYNSCFAKINNCVNRKITVTTCFCNHIKILFAEVAKFRLKAFLNQIRKGKQRRKSKQQRCAKAKVFL